MKKSELEPEPRLPIKLDSASNGEYWPLAPSRKLAELDARLRAAVGPAARRLGLTRRQYLTSSCAVASALLGMNELGCGGGSYQLPKEAPHEQAAADTVVQGEEFIVDVQTHQVSTERPWWDVKEPSLADFLTTIPQAKCGEPQWARCFSDDVLIREVFLESDTQVAVLSALWGSPSPMLAAEAAKTRDKVQAVGKGSRLLIHGIVQPNEGPWEQVRDHMHDLAETWKIDAWKLYTVWGPNREGYWLDEELGHKTIAHGLSLGRSLFAVHKGLPLPGMNASYTSPRDVGPAAKAFPQATFLIYHSGWEAEHTEGPYDPKSERGVDGLIRSVETSGLGPEAKVYAELGSTWRELMKKPDQAAHVLGKLLKHFGEDRILWGTDAIWYGSPQDQIQAFRAFEISPEFQGKHGYPALTKRVKAKILGLNAARVYGIDVPQRRAELSKDTVSRVRAEREANPSFQTLGPKTRREMLALLKAAEGRPD
jgi:uncharacterized protein